MDRQASAMQVDRKPIPRSRPRLFSSGRIGLYIFAFASMLFFLLPFWVMLVTSLKPMDEIRLGNLLAWPHNLTFQPWIAAWSSACTGLVCDGIRGGFVNSVLITVPAVIISVLFGAINGYAISTWKPRGADLLFGGLVLGAFIPYQVFVYPMTRILANFGLFGSLGGLIGIHVIFGLPLTTMLFRNFYAGMPPELFKAARVDGAGFWKMFVYVMLPMSMPILVVALVLQVTGIWNDYLLGFIFGGSSYAPMTLQLNNIVNTVEGERNYNIDMAATIITALVPLLVYFLSGKLLVRGVTAGAVKG